MKVVMNNNDKTLTEEIQMRYTSMVLRMKNMDKEHKRALAEARRECKRQLNEAIIDEIIAHKNETELLVEEATKESEEAMLPHKSEVEKVEKVIREVDNELKRLKFHVSKAAVILKKYNLIKPQAGSLQDGASEADERASNAGIIEQYQRTIALKDDEISALKSKALALEEYIESQIQLQSLSSNMKSMAQVDELVQMPSRSTNAFGRSPNNVASFRRVGTISSQTTRKNSFSMVNTNQFYQLWLKGGKTPEIDAESDEWDESDLSRTGSSIGFQQLPSQNLTYRLPSAGNLLGSRISVAGKPPVFKTSSRGRQQPRKTILASLPPLVPRPLFTAVHAHATAHSHPFENKLRILLTPQHASSPQQNASACFPRNSRRCTKTGSASTALRTMLK
ncbi:hypothetical protein BJ742DRAFT_560954 [Cladochytrium replicatum]|nr:hypothetical protein BJ742DRAFT_560954 [Cladochytrium replicatum]